MRSSLAMRAGTASASVVMVARVRSAGADRRAGGRGTGRFRDAWHEPCVRRRWPSVVMLSSADGVADVARRRTSREPGGTVGHPSRHDARITSRSVPYFTRAAFPTALEVEVVVRRTATRGAEGALGVPTHFTMSMVSAVLLACSLVLPSTTAYHHSAISFRRYRGPRMCAESTGAALCRQLQNGESVSDSMGALLTTAGAQDFLSSYLTEDEWTCADRAPAAALADVLAAAPPSVLDKVLMSVVSGAASSSERSVSRARLLVNALWARAPALRSSCAALQDTVADKLGEDVPVVWDANYEYAKDEWAGILHFAKYDAAQLERIARAGAVRRGRRGRERTCTARQRRGAGPWTLS